MHVCIYCHILQINMEFLFIFNLEKIGGGKKVKVIRVNSRLFKFFPFSL